MLQALRTDAAGAPAFPEGGWQSALDFADQTHLTLPLRDRIDRGGWREGIPEPVRQRLDRNLADNTERWQRLEAESARIEERLDAAGIEFVVLKGATHSPDFIPDPRLRAQYDFDFYCPREAAQARVLLLELGYEPAERFDDLPTDHLPTMVRKTGWRWRGNYFDPEIPPSVDLHFRLWDAATERIAAPGVGQFWGRRAGRALGLADRLGYAALHALRHLLRGSLRLSHVYEIARFLEARKDDAAFWTRWRELHPPELRRLESIVFEVAARYFGAPDLPDGGLAPDVALWLERYAWSPVEALFRPNKHELYLHMALVDSWTDRWAVARRRLIPATLPGPVEGIYTPAGLTIALRIRKWTKYAAFLAGRLWHHARLLAPTLWGLASWKRAR